MIRAPVDLRIRAFDPDRDLAEVVRVLNAENEADDVDERETEADLGSHVAHASEQFDARRDLAVGEVDGRIVAVGGQDWVDTRDGLFREHRMWGAVEPDYRRRGIGTAMLADNERRAAALAATQDTDRPHTYAGWASDGRPGSRLLKASGYELVRWFFDMVRPDLEDLPEPPALPDGLELRPVTPDLHTIVWRGNREAFRDHWGGGDESEAAMHRFFDAPDRDPSLWLVAFDGDEVAAGVFNGIYPAENAALGIQRGWLDSVFTRRPWRRRGLARTLILRSLRLLKERGMTSAALGVDAENPTGALGLYESAGFAVHDRFTAWRKPMDAAS
jgi:GNAT superfamily N-acetyltransferase